MPRIATPPTSTPPTSTPPTSTLRCQGVKLELFIFDTFPLASRAALLEVAREEEFAPVKNAPGSAADTPESARDAILSLHAGCAAAALRCAALRCAVIFDDAPSRLPSVLQGGMLVR